MSRSQRYFFVVSSLATIGTVIVIGCSQPTATPPAAANPATVTPSDETVTTTSATPAAKGASPEEHPHIPGAHGGIVIPIGPDSYHAEATVEMDGRSRYLVRVADEARSQEVAF